MRIGYPLTLGTGQPNSFPFNQLFSESVCVTHRNVLNREVDAIVIWGGEDISPSIYNHRVSKFTGASDKMSDRDIVEYGLFQAAVDAGIPIIGVCRGAQLACAASGGSLVQHVSGHAGTPHGVTLADGRNILVNSLHHQMMYPFETEHKLLGWSEKKLSKYYIGQDDVDIDHMHDADTPEPEFVYFPETKALAIQGHPEFMPNTTNDFVQYTLELTQKLMQGEL